jgi:hypothetical protein
LQDEREGDQRCRYRFHLKSAQHAARLPRQFSRAPCSGCLHRHTENDKLISNPDKNGSSAIRSCQSQGRIQGFNPQISQSPQRSLTSPDLGSPPTDGGSFHSLLTVNPLSDRRGIFGDKTCRLPGRHRAHTPH